MPQIQSFDAMRQDAIRRSREMQRHAAEPIAPAASPASESNPLSGSMHLPEELQGLLSGWDAEKLALLALLYLLYKEGTELRLLLAIAYIIL